MTDPQPEVPGFGCGLAAYGSLLIAFAAVGVIGSVASMAALIFIPSARGPSLLMHGSKVQVWQLQPMRDAGLLELTEAPLAWHDESDARDGTTACGFRTGALIRIEDGVGTALPFEGITALSHEGAEDVGITMTAVGTDPSGQAATITCRFGDEEGGARFLTQLQVETDLFSQSVEAPR